MPPEFILTLFCWQLTWLVASINVFCWHRGGKIPFYPFKKPPHRIAVPSSSPLAAFSLLASLMGWQRLFQCMETLLVRLWARGCSVRPQPCSCTLLLLFWGGWGSFKGDSWAQINIFLDSSGPLPLLPIYICPPGMTNGSGGTREGFHPLDRSMGLGFAVIPRAKLINQCYSFTFLKGKPLRVLGFSRSPIASTGA